MALVNFEIRCSEIASEAIFGLKQPHNKDQTDCIGVGTRGGGGGG